METLNLNDLVPKFDEIGIPPTLPETPDQLSAIFVAALLVVFSIFFLYTIYYYFVARHRTQWIQKQLRKESPESILRNHKLICERATKTGHTGCHLWNEFDETLVETTMDDELRLCNVYDASHFFNASTLAREITQNRMLAAVPGFLTALGVIGTFMGLQLGLSGLEIGKDIPVDKMTEGVAKVIGGATIAFMSSVWGVLLSVLFNFFEKVLEGHTNTRISRLQIRIDELFPRFSPEIQLKRIADDGSQSREALQGLAERIGKQLQESLLIATEGIQQGLEQSLDKIMSPAIQKLVDETSSGNQQALESLIDQFLEKFGETGSAQRDAMSKASEGVNVAMKTMSQDLSGFMRGLEQHQNNVQQREVELVRNLSTQIETLSDTTQTQVSEMRTALDNVVKSINATVGDHKTSTESLLEQGRQLQGDFSRSQELTKSIADGLKDGASQLNEAVIKLREYGEAVGNATQAMNSSILQATNAAGAMSAENKQLVASVTQIVNELNGGLAKMQTLVTALDSTTRLADGAFTNMKAHQDQYLQSLKENVKELSEHGTQLLSEFAEQANAQTREHLGEWARHVSTFASQMTTLGRSLSDVVDEIDNKFGT